MNIIRSCIWGHGSCTAPNTVCPHWIGIYCELDEVFGIEMSEIEEELVTVAERIKGESNGRIL